MKSIRLLLFLALTAVAFNSCSDSDPIQNNNAAEESIALRTMVFELKKANGINNRMQDANPFCFDFVYPVNFTFSTGTSISAETFAGLMEIIANETPQIYLEAIEFPFDVMHSGAIETISTEEEFTALLEECGFNTFSDDLQSSFCFDIIFPIQIFAPDQTLVTINSNEELQAHIENPTNGIVTPIVFPISVVYENQTIVIDNIYEFYQLVGDCSNDCICTQEYVPVCVQTANGVFEFGNMCYAMCAGYTQNDLVNCNPTTACGISNLEVSVGNCNADNSYQLTINFTYENASSTQFTVTNGNGFVIGTYPLTSLPVTVNFPSVTNATDFVTVSIGNNTNCTATQMYTLPNCDCGCPTDFDPVCVQTTLGLVQYDNACQAICAGHSQNDFVSCVTSTYNFGQLLGSCFDMVYPVQVQHMGAVVTVTVDGQLLQYWNPAQGQMPAMVYPVSVIFNNTTYIFNSQAEFEAQIATSCN